MEEEIVRSVFSVSSCDRNSGPLPRGSQSRRGLGQLHPPSCETSTREEEKKTNQEKTATKTNSDKIQDLPSDLILLQPGLSKLENAQHAKDEDAKELSDDASARNVHERRKIAMWRTSGEKAKV